MARRRTVLKRPPEPTDTTPPARAALMWAEICAWEADRSMRLARWATILWIMAVAGFITNALTHAMTH